MSQSSGGGAASEGAGKVSGLTNASPGGPRNASGRVEELVQVAVVRATSSATDNWMRCLRGRLFVRGTRGGAGATCYSVLMVTQRRLLRASAKLLNGPCSTRIGAINAGQACRPLRHAGVAEVGAARLTADEAMRPTFGVDRQVGESPDQRPETLSS